MQDMWRLVKLYAPLPREILIIGETGVGKGLVARWIHHLSGRSGDFVVVTGGSMSESLYQSQLFGHLQGAFTDAKMARKGAFEQAAGGTLFLDELPLWPKTVQSGLLRAISDRAIRPLGAQREIPISCRVLFASTRSLDAMVLDSTLLPDLRWRVPFFEIRIPPLKDRQADILRLAHYFLEAAATDFACTRVTGFCAESYAALLGHQWPGNVRELRGVVERAVAHAGADCDDLVRPHHLPKQLTGARKPLTSLDRTTIQAAVAWALKHTGGHRSAAASLLGIHRNTVTRRAQRRANVDGQGDAVHSGFDPT